jgi:hypothetical protein
LFVEGNKIGIVIIITENKDLIVLVKSIASIQGAGVGYRNGASECFAPHHVACIVNSTDGSRSGYATTILTIRRKYQIAVLSLVYTHWVGGYFNTGIY